MKKLLSLLSSALLVAVFTTGTAAAQIYGDIDVGGGASGSVGGSGGVSGSADTSADLTIDSDYPDDDSSTSSSDDASSDSDSGANVGTTINAGAGLSLTQREAAQVSIDAESAALVASSVATNEDLSLYATSKLKRDASLRRIDASSESVRVSYRQEARFLGVIPAGITAHATVTNSGGVDIDYPWYRFLFAVEHDTDAEAQLESEVRELLAAQADASAGFSATTEAELIDRLYVALSGSANATASATTQ